jgi:glycosyltransferase involved in cell wall biosynthesis
MPRISVIMAVYNSADVLSETLDSLQHQTYRDWELICVDDGSTDNSLQLLRDRAVRDDRIRLHQLEQNLGLTKALIRGCELAKAEYLARQDAGDLSLPNRLEKQVYFLDENPGVVAVGSGIARMGPRGEKLLDHIEHLTPEQVTQRFLQSGKAIVHAGAMFRRSAYVACGGYRKEFRVAQDIDLWYRMTEYGLLAEIDEVLFAVRIDASGITALNNDRQHALAAIARASHEARRRGESDSELLKQAALISSGTYSGPISSRSHNRRRVGEGNYFLGSELFMVRNPNCRYYLWAAAMNGTCVPRSISKLLLSYFRCRKGCEYAP